MVCRINSQAWDAPSDANDAINDHPEWIRDYGNSLDGKTVENLQECYTACSERSAGSAVGYSPVFKAS